MLAVTIAVVLWLGWLRQPSIQPVSISMQGEATEFLKPSNDSAQGHDGTPQALLKVAQLHKPALLDLNRASADELETLPGIGAVLAQRVVAFRESAGQFRTVEDLRGVKGIGAKKFDRLKSLVTVSTREIQRETERRAS
jgi:competence protein ComEA